MDNAKSDIKIDYSRFGPDRPPVLVLGGLSQVWPLGFARIPVIVGTADRNNPALDSRYLCGYCLLPSNPKRKDEIVGKLMWLGRELHGAARRKIPLFCGNDQDLSLTFEFHGRLQEHYIPAGNDPDLGMTFLQKDRFHTLAAAFDLPVPRTYFWYGNGDNLADIENPLLVKPIQKEAWGQQGGFDSLFHAKAAVFPNGRALVARPDMVSLKDRIVIQEYIPGSDSQIYSFHGFTDDDGGLMEYFLGRKIRTFPQCTGESSFIEMIKDEELFRTGKNIVDKLGLRGVFKIDFKRNAGNGRFYMLEINPRFNLWLYLACANGINILRTAYEYLVYGIRRRPAGYSTRYKWNNFLLDCHAYRELHSLGELGFVAWIKSLLTPRVQNVFLWKDPAPFLRWASGYVQHRIWRSMES